MWRAAVILEAIAAAERPLGPTALAKQLGLAKSSVANVCAALTGTGLLRRTSDGYALGWRLAELGGAYLASVDEVREFHAACDALGEHEATLQLAGLGDDLEVVYLARRDGRAVMRLASDVGRRLPANCTAVGKALLAHLSDAELDARLGEAPELPRLTPRSIRSVDDLRAELANVRRRGYALDLEETVEGIVCLAVPVLAPINARVGVTATILAPHATEETLGRLHGLVSDVATRISGRPDRG